MIFFAGNEPDLTAALMSGANPIEIEITASFYITTTHYVMPEATIYSSPTTTRQTLTRAPGFTGNMFEVQPSQTLTLRDLDLDGNRQVVGTVTGSIVYNDGELNLLRAGLRNNSSTNEGGAILNAPNGVLIVEYSVFENNHSNMNGGAICSHGEIRGLLKYATFGRNSATGNGGALFYDNYSHDLTVEGGDFESNTALNGGGMYLRSLADMPRTYRVIERSIFRANKAVQDGGAIWVYRLPALFVIFPSEFIGNRAWQGYFIDPADIPLHQTHIQAVVFTTPFTYGYNNFDINYKSNFPYREEVECDVVGSQTVDLCVPVTVTPSAIAGPTVVRCCGPAVITPGTNVCPGTPNPDCSFTISQRLCIEVPVEFGAHAEAGQTHTNCGTASGSSTCGELCTVPIEAEDAKASEEATPEDE